MDGDPLLASQIAIESNQLLFIPNVPLFGTFKLRVSSIGSVSVEQLYTVRVCGDEEIFYSGA